MPGTGRFAPSPSGELHVGNLRTAAVAWLTARSGGRSFLLRVEDLDGQRSRPEFADGHTDDLHAIGLTWDAEPVRQSTRLNAYREALGALAAAGHTYECYCSRREIRDAQSAPHSAGRYPGTCRELSDSARVARRRSSGRPPTIRLRGNDVQRTWVDLVRGSKTGVADDVVLARWDGALAYNLAVVVDDLWQGVEQVVRGDDLVDQTATQLLLTELLSSGKAPQVAGKAPQVAGKAPRVEYGHVPLVLNSGGKRLAKRDGAVTIRELANRGVDSAAVVRMLLRSMGEAVRPDATTLSEAVDGFDITRLAAAPWTFTPPRGC